MILWCIKPGSRVNCPIIHTAAFSGGQRLEITGAPIRKCTYCNVAVGSMNALQVSSAVHGTVLDVTVEDGEVAMPAIMELLNCEGVKLKRIKATKPTLDDVFLKYAGMRQQRNQSGYHHGPN